MRVGNGCPMKFRRWWRYRSRRRDSVTIGTSDDDEAIDEFSWNNFCAFFGYSLATFERRETGSKRHRSAHIVLSSHCTERAARRSAFFVKAPVSRSRHSNTGFNPCESVVSWSRTVRSSSVGYARLKRFTSSRPTSVIKFRCVAITVSISPRVRAGSPNTMDRSRGETPRTAPPLVRGN